MLHNNGESSSVISSSEHLVEKNPDDVTVMSSGYDSAPHWTHG